AWRQRRAWKILQGPSGILLRNNLSGSNRRSNGRTTTQGAPPAPFDAAPGPWPGGTPSRAPDSRARRPLSVIEALRTGYTTKRVNINVRQLPDAHEKGITLLVSPVAVVVPEHPQAGLMVLQQPGEKGGRPRWRVHCLRIGRPELPGVTPDE